MARAAARPGQTFDHIASRTGRGGGVGAAVWIALATGQLYLLAGNRIGRFAPGATILLTAVSASTVWGAPIDRGRIDADHPSLIAAIDATGEHIQLALSLAEIFGGQPPSLIVPVLFLSEDRLKPALPRVAQELNFDHAELGEDYAKLGILGLLREGQFPRYRKVVDALAERIVSLASKNPLVPAEVNDMADVENAFSDMGPDGEPEDEQVGPGYAKFVYVVAPARDFQEASFQRQTDYYGRNRLEWRPYQPDSAEALALVAQQVTSQGKFYYEVLQLDAPDLTQRLQRAQANSNIVIMVVDAWTLRLESYYEIVQAFGGDMGLDFVVVVPWNLKDAQTKDQQKTLKSVLSKVLGERIRSGDPNLLLNPVTSADELTVRLAATLEYMRQRLVSSAPGLVVEAGVKFTELPVASAVAAAPGGKGR